ncbi:MAG TPA: hypothetical protein VLI71_06785, partial [Gammaproteobacteria bacterium]|nr:hypothetical protein [Gammaproteobacteria bacterium]
DLGALTEDRLQAALNQILGNSCPAATGQKPSFTKPANDAVGDEADIIVHKSPLLMNRILEAP